MVTDTFRSLSNLVTAKYFFKGFGMSVVDCERFWRDHMKKQTKIRIVQRERRWQSKRLKPIIFTNKKKRFESFIFQPFYENLKKEVK